MGYVLAAVFVGGMIILNRLLRRREQEGVWDKEGHGMREHQEPGVKFRRLEVPPEPPFD